MRPQGWTKSGYYPTPLPVIKLLEPPLFARCAGNHRSLDPPKPPPVPEFHLLDPCCGEGHAVAAFANAITRQISRSCPNYPHRVVTHGVELNSERAAAARHNLHHVLQADLENVALQPESADALWLNPPYDWDADNAPANHDTGDNRLESRFLRSCLPALRPDGLLAYVIPLQQLDRDAATLANNFYNIGAARFPDPEYGQYQQIILWGQRKIALNNPESREPHVARSLRKLANGPLPDFPVLGQPVNLLRVSLNPQLTVNFRPIPNRPRPIARRREYDPATLSRAAAAEGCWASGDTRAQLRPQGHSPPAPTLQPLNSGHTLQLLASGQLDNHPITDPQGELPPILLKGQIRKVAEITEIPHRKATETENFTNSIRYLNLANGQITTVDDGDPEALRDFLHAWRRPLKSRMTDLFPPTVIPTEPRYRPIRERIARLKKPPIGKQGANAVALAAHLRKNRRGFIISQPGSGKTWMAVAAAAGANCARVIVILPRHIIPRWISEITDCNPQAKVRVIESIRQPPNRPAPDPSLRSAHGDLESALTLPATPDAPLWLLLPQTTASLGWAVASVTRHVSAAGPHRLYRHEGPDGSLQLAVARNFRGETCPRCWRVLTDDARWENAKNRRDARCPGCRLHLKAPTRPPGTRWRCPIGDYIAQKHPRWADLLILDEAHQYKSNASARGEVAGRLAQRSQRAIGLTGTFLGGCASSVFYLLQRLLPGFQRNFPWDQRSQFINQYGRYRTVWRSRPETDGGRTGAVSAARQQQSRKEEIPGFHPGLLNHILYCSVFTTLPELIQALPPDDPRRQLPPPEIIPTLVPLEDTPGTALAAPPALGEAAAETAQAAAAIAQNRAADAQDTAAATAASDADAAAVATAVADAATAQAHAEAADAAAEAAAEAAAAIAQNRAAEAQDAAAEAHAEAAKAAPRAAAPTPNYSQRSAYQALEQALRDTVKQELNHGNAPTLATMLQELLTYPENCWQGAAPTSNSTGETIINLPPLPANHTYPKERELIRICQAEKDQNRKFIIYCTHTNTRSTVQRTQAILQQHHITTAYMDAARVKPEKRMQWFQDQARHHDGIIVNPKAVETGIDLLDYPTIIWQEIEYSMYTTDQASARSNRISQTQPIRIHYLAYAGTMQEQALRKVAQKSDASRAIYGELARNGLSMMNPAADKFSDIVENELYRELERERRGQLAQSPTETLLEAELKELLNRSEPPDDPDEPLVSDPIKQAFQPQPIPTPTPTPTPTPRPRPAPLPAPTLESFPEPVQLALF